MPSTSPSSGPSLFGEQLEKSQSATLYVDADALDEAAAAALLSGDPPLYAEHDSVRDKWAIRRATDEEVAEATAEATPAVPSSTSTSSTTSSSSSTSA